MKRVPNQAILDLVADGLTNDELCATLGITTRTFTRWRVASPGLSADIIAIRARITAERQRETQAHGTHRRYCMGCRCEACTEANRMRCYINRIDRRARLGLPPPDNRVGRRPKHFVTVRSVPSRSLADRIGQRIACGQSPSRIIADLGIDYRQYRAVRVALDQAVAS